MAVTEDVAALVADMHLTKVETGWYRDRLRRATGPGIVAKAAGLSPSVLDAVVRGDVTPSPAQYFRIAEALRTYVSEPAGVAS